MLIFLMNLILRVETRSEKVANSLFDIVCTFTVEYVSKTCTTSGYSTDLKRSTSMKSFSSETMMFLRIKTVDDTD